MGTDQRGGGVSALSRLDVEIGAQFDRNANPTRIRQFMGTREAG